MSTSPCDSAGPHRFDSRASRRTGESPCGSDGRVRLRCGEDRSGVSPMVGDELLDHRGVIVRREVDREIEREPGRRGDDEIPSDERRCARERPSSSDGGARRRRGPMVAVWCRQVDLAGTGQSSEAHQLTDRRCRSGSPSTVSEAEFDASLLRAFAGCLPSRYTCSPAGTRRPWADQAITSMPPDAGVEQHPIRGHPMMGGEGVQCCDRQIVHESSRGSRCSAGDACADGIAVRLAAGSNSARSESPRATRVARGHSDRSWHSDRHVGLGSAGLRGWWLRWPDADATDGDVGDRAPGDARRDGWRELPRARRRGQRGRRHRHVRRLHDERRRAARGDGQGPAPSPASRSASTCSPPCRGRSSAASRA